MPEVAYRQAGLDDAAEIHALLLRLAPEIPLLVDTLEREEALYALVRDCARSGESWAACDASGHIVGFALVEPNQRSRHYAESEVLELRYLGVEPERRGQGVLRTLVGKITARMLPVTATISAQNRWQLADHLKTAGFRETAAAGGDHHLRWEPGSKAP